MQFFIAVDLYNHASRNFFGFKKKNVMFEQRPATITIYTNAGDVYSAQFKGAKLKDDIYWDGRIVNPADFGHPKRLYEIVTEAADFINQRMGEEDYKLFTDRDVDLQSGYVHRFMYEIHRAMECVSEDFVSLYDYERNVVGNLPDSAFKHGPAYHEKFVLFIHKPEGTSYTSDQKIELFHSHIRRSTILPLDMSRVRAQKMSFIFRLISKTEYDATEHLNY